MVLRSGPVVDERQERIAGVRTKYLIGDVPPERAARISCTLGLPDGSGYVRLDSADPGVQPSFNYRYLQHPNDIRRVREGLRLAVSLLESDAYKDVVDHRIHPTDDILANDDALDLWIRQTVGYGQARVGDLQDGAGRGSDGGCRPALQSEGRPGVVRGRCVGDAAHSAIGRRPCDGDHDRRTCRRLDCDGVTVRSGCRVRHAGRPSVSHPCKGTFGNTAFA